MVAHSDILRIF